MKGIWWKMPILRGLSPMRRGIVEAFGFVLVVSLASSLLLHRAFAEPTSHLCEALAQIGATLLVAYAVETSWVLQSSRRRGSDRENWVGVMAGLGGFALLGIGFALALSSYRDPFSLLQELGFAWAIVSIGMLGIWVAIQPWAMYEWTHSLNTEYPDE
jgi:hypothetical protein